MQNEQTVQDATRLLLALSTNHAEARMATPHGLDRTFSPNWADAEQAGLDWARRDAAMKWLVDKNMLERHEEAEDLLGTGEGFHSEYASVFKITDSGRELLEEAREERRPGGAS
jgi:predicted transcriptional regulator